MIIIDAAKSIMGFKYLFPQYLNHPITFITLIYGLILVLFVIISENGHFCQKWPFSDQKKWHIEWPNKNSKTTFIVQTFPKYGPYGFDLRNLSLLGAILAIFQFCGFSGLFWPFFPCK